jgi:hypothetical protein
MLDGGDGLLGPLFYALPLWGVGLLLFVVCIFAREAGALFFRRLKARDPEALDSGKDADSYIITAIFALLAFVIGLSLSIALDRFEGRRALVVDEANAISTSYLRADLFDEPYRSQLQATLRDYARTRIAPDGLWDARMEAQLARSLALRTRLWDETRTAVYPVRETELGSYFIEAINELLNVGTRRQLAGRANIPARIIDVLFIYMIAAAAVLGYLLGDRPGLKRQATTVLLLLFTIMIMTILDLDRPQSGAIQVPQRALEELVARLDRDAPPPVRP